MQHSIDTALIVLAWAAFLCLSVFAVVKTLRGTSKGYGQMGVLPDSWRRWIYDETVAAHQKKEVPAPKENV